MLIRLAIHLIPHCKSCISSPESMEMSIFKKTKNVHGRSLEREKHLQTIHWKNPPLRKKVEQQHVKHAGRYVNLEIGWA